MFRFLLLLVAGWLLLVAPAQAETVGDSTRAVRPASATALLRHPAPARYAALRARADLRYDPPGYQPRLTWWDRFWAWFWGRINDVFRSRASRTGGQWLWYAFLLGTMTWVILRVLKLDVGSLFRRAPRAAPAYDVEAAESPFTDDLAARLADAEARADHRLAVRLGYLLTLRQLADRDLIRWLPDKTNHHYLRELPAGPVREGFAPLTRAFEAAWYGDLLPTAAEYAAFTAQRAELTRALPAGSVANAESPSPAPFGKFSVSA